MLYYTMNDKEAYLDTMKDFPISKKKKEQFYNIPCAFDIETTSFYEEDNKRSCMYIWQLGINDQIIIGRTWEEFIEIINLISIKLELNLSKRLIIYVHNLAFEFQFIRKLFEWDNVFAMDSHKPVYAISTLGVEFRCSYLLSGYSLESLGKNLTKYKVEKLTGYLDYDTMRNSKTHLTEKEILYCINDVKVVMSYIRECMEQEHNQAICNIPLTKTGYVRRRVRQHVLSPENRKEYTRQVAPLKLELSEYKLLREAFAGGYTHASIINVMATHENVGSFDFTSSYPAVLLTEEYPMSKGRKYTPKDSNDLKRILKYYCSLFKAEFTNIRAKNEYCTMISRSKCPICENVICDNGRVYTADRLVTTITDVDFKQIMKFYDFDNVNIYDMYVYNKGYLPKAFIEVVLDLYKKKTTLKGVIGQEVEYMSSKADLNALYGMCVTDIVRDENMYENDNWDVEMGDADKSLTFYNRNCNRFLSYAWGVWCTAYARANLFSGIEEMKEDLIYSDTDSIKGVNMNNHLDYFLNYNRNILFKLNCMCCYYQLDPELCSPKTIKGKVKTIGFWDYEGDIDRSNNQITLIPCYKKFKTLGAKRYMFIDDKDVLSLTVSGINKKKAVPYLEQLAIDKSVDVFDLFDDDLDIPGDYTGKLTHTYLDYETKGTIVDYQGNVAEYHELSSVHLEKASYSMSLDNNYIILHGQLKRERGAL